MAQSNRTTSIPNTSRHSISGSEKSKLLTLHFLCSAAQEPKCCKAECCYGLQYLLRTLNAQTIEWAASGSSMQSASGGTDRPTSKNYRPRKSGQIIYINNAVTPALSSLSSSSNEGVLSSLQLRETKQSLALESSANDNRVADCTRILFLISCIVVALLV